MKLLKLTIILGLALTFMQCEPEVQLEETFIPVTADEVTIEKIAKLGFDVQNYPVWKDGEYYTVEGDINIPASYLDALDHNDQHPEAEQRRWVNIVSCNEIRYITVYNNLPSGTARNTVNLAMQHWNEITKCNIRFAATGNINTAEIIISKGSLPTNQIGRGTFPLNGKPGKYIRLDLDQWSSFDYAQWRSTVEHELGHNIGFAHANGTSSNEIFIPGTPGVDNNSLMNGGRGGTVRKVTEGDKKAARLLYNLNFADRLCN